MNWPIKVIYFAVFYFLALNNFAFASVISAASCSQTDVQAAIDSAADSDIVNIPPGSCTWTSPLNITYKSITVQGSGIDQTIITNGCGSGWNESPFFITGKAGKSFRITALTLKGPFSTSGGIQIRGDCKEWRVDNLKITQDPPNTSGRAIKVIGETYGVIDHCLFTKMRNCIDVSWGAGTIDDLSWSTPLSLGTADAVYIEDNTFSCTAADGCTHMQAVDSGDGARYVFRYNNLEDSYVHTHGACYSGSRGTFSIEFYNNTFTANRNIETTWTAMSSYGGTGVIFNNTIGGTFGYQNAITVSNDRSFQSNVCNPPLDVQCDGTSSLDGNTPTKQGWPCLDQIGRGTDQSSEPLYEWNNIKNVADADVYVHIASTHIVENQDYFNDTARPGYTPYQYPHPLVSLPSPSLDTITVK